MAPDSNRSRRWSDIIERAARLRACLFGSFGAEPVTNAYRLLNDSGDGAEGFTVDAYAGFLVVQVLDSMALQSAPALVEALEKILQPRGIVQKLRYQQTERGRVPGQIVQGESPPCALGVLENSVPLEVELLEGLHTGLFTDMREEHARMRQLAVGRRVLNTFAYTGAFSVAAALGGATSVTSVDVIARPLDRAKRNFELSGVETTAHHFVRMEVIEYLQLAKRRGWTFQAIVLDPPTFATFKSGHWSARTGYKQLLQLALGVLDPEGLLWAAANTESMPPERFEQLIGHALREARRNARVIALGGLPPDYPTPIDNPQARYLKVHLLQA